MKISPQSKRGSQKEAGRYMFYRSAGQSTYRSAVPRPEPRRRNRAPLVIIFMVVVAAGFVGFAHLHHQKQAVAETAVTQKQPAVASIKQTPKATSSAASNDSACATNDLDKLVVVSISERHLWACQDANQQYDSPVVTGMQKLAADLTPTGTYHVYAKQDHITLKGSDSTGSWNDPVSYWLPFLDNQYGTYGFHDATWRDDSDFGNIDPNSDQGSHGCVELPLAAAAWLYDWAQVGTTVTVKA